MLFFKPALTFLPRSGTKNQMIGAVATARAVGTSSEMSEASRTRSRSTTGNGKIDTEMHVKKGAVEEALIDTTGNGVPDQRESYRDGKRVRLEADTNDDQRPDVVQRTEPDGTEFQDEDTDFDGVLDQRFRGDSQIALPPNTAAPAPLPEMQCGDFHSFWRR